MLVTKIKYGEKIRIGDDIVVTVLEAKYPEERDRLVRVMVDAPREIPITRPEWSKKRATDGDEENPDKTP
jgi:carbon storage regulator CsrA